MLEPPLIAGATREVAAEPPVAAVVAEAGINTAVGAAPAPPSTRFGSAATA